MLKFLFLLVVAGLVFGGVSPARADAYLSVTGVDSNNCGNPETPCRFLRGALAKSFGGNIIMLTPGIFTYSGAEISSSTTISGVPGAVIEGQLRIINSNLRVNFENLTFSPLGAILFEATNSKLKIKNSTMENWRISVSAANNDVSLTNVTMDASRIEVNANNTALSIDNVTIENVAPSVSVSFPDCVQFFSSGKLSVKNSTLRNFSHFGFYIGSGARFLIEDTVVSSNKPGTDTVGIAVWADGVTPANGTIRRVSVTNNAAGMRLVASNATVTDSVFSNNSGDGILLGTSARQKVDLWVERSVFSNNPRGVRLFGNTRAFSSGDNFFVNNGRDVYGALTPITKQ